jgi:hypothetical protein
LAAHATRLLRHPSIAAAAILLGACSSLTEPPTHGGGGGDGPTLSVVAHAARPTRLTLRDGELFWLDTSATPLRKLALSSGVETALVTALPIPESVAPDGAQLYWIAGGTLYQTTLDGNVTTVLDRGSRDPTSAATASVIHDGENVYWVNTVADEPCSPACSSTIRRVPKSGGAATTIATTLGIIRSIAVHDGFVYWESERFGPTNDDGSTGSKIGKISLSDGTITILVDGRLNGLIPRPTAGSSPYTWAVAGGFVVDDSAIYFEDGSIARSSRMYKVPVAGGPLTVLITDISADPATFARDLSSDETNIYWIDATSVRSIAKGGGAITNLATNRTSPVSLARSGSDLYWVETACCAHGQRGTIQRMSASGGSPIAVASNIDAPVSVAADLSKLYWAAGGPVGNTEKFGAITESGLDGSAADTVVESVSGGPFAVDGSNVYIADGFTIKRVPAGGGPVRRVAIADFYVRDIATDGAFVYWVEDPFSTIRRMPVEGGPIETLASGTGPASILHLNADYVYWLDHNDVIYRVPKSGGGRQTVVGNGTGTLADFVLDGTNVYFAEWDGGSLCKVPLAGGTITILASLSPDQNRRLATAASTLFWIDQSEVGKVSISAGGAQTQTLVLGGLGADPFVPPSIVVDATTVYWSEVTTSLIRKAVPK